MKAVVLFTGHPALALTWPRFLPRANEVSHAFFAPIATAIRARVRTSQVVFCADGKWRRASDCRQPSSYSDVVDGDRTPLVDEAYLSFYYISPDYASDVVSLLDVKAMEYNDFLDGLLKMHTAHIFVTQSGEWLEEICAKIIKVGITRQRKMTVIKSEDKLRRLPLARRRDGTWSACSVNQKVQFMLGDDRSTFPTGLAIELLDTNDLGPNRCQLLKHLGVCTMYVQLVVEKILEAHRSPSFSLTTAQIESHLAYLFEQRHVHRRAALGSSIWLLDTGGSRTRGSELYMDSHKAKDSIPRLSEILPAPARFLNPSLVTLFQRQSVVQHGSWLEWLHTTLNVATAPRVAASGHPSKEFVQLISNLGTAQTSLLLSLFRTYWPAISAQLSASSQRSAATTFKDVLGQMSVLCANGLRAPLSATYLLSASVRPFVTDDMAVLPVPDSSSDWNFLRSFGVNLDINAFFFLKHLRAISKTDYRTVKADLVEEIYRQLEARFHDMPNEIRYVARH